MLGGYAVAGALAIANQQGEIASNASILTIGVPLGASLIAPAPRLASRCSRERRYAWSLAGAVAGAGLGYLAGAGTRASAERIQFRTGAGGLIGVIAGAELCR